MACTHLNGMVWPEARGLAGKLLSHPVSLPTGKACACCPLVDLEIELAADRELTRSRKTEGQLHSGAETERYGQREMNTDRDRDKQGTEK